MFIILQNNSLIVTPILRNSNRVGASRSLRLCENLIYLFWHEAASAGRIYLIPLYENVFIQVIVLPIAISGVLKPTHEITEIPPPFTSWTLCVCWVFLFYAMAITPAYHFSPYNVWRPSLSFMKTCVIDVIYSPPINRAMFFRLWRSEIIFVHKTKKRNNPYHALSVAMIGITRISFCSPLTVGFYLLQR